MAKRGKSALSIGVDLDGVESALGFVTGMTQEMNTSRFLGSVIEFAHSDLSQEFDTTMDAMAVANHAAFHHVYEWRQLGSPSGRLWTHRISGRGKKAVATWQWRASREPILTPEERASDPYNTGDPMAGVDAEDIEQLSGRTYYFYWKAPMMEYDMTVTILPKFAKALFIPMWEAENGFIFSKSAIGGAGGEATTGAFTAQWVAWWEAVAPAVFERGVKRSIENDLGAAEKELGRATRGKGKKFKLGAVTNERAAFKNGKLMAEQYIRNRASSYTAAAKATAARASVYGGSNF